MFIFLLLSFIHVRDVAFTPIYAIVRPSSSIKIRKKQTVCVVLSYISFCVCVSFSFSSSLFRLCQRKIKALEKKKENIIMHEEVSWPSG